MTAGVLDLSIEQGATWTRTLTWFEADETTPIPVTGYTARAMLRQNYRDPAIAVSLTSEPGGGIELQAPNIVVITITDEQTAAIDFLYGVWDFEFAAPDGTVLRWLQGRVAVSPEVTR